MAKVETALVLDDAAAVELLRWAGVRIRPPPAMVDAVAPAVRREWRVMSAQTLRRRRSGPLVLSGKLACIAFIAALTFRWMAIQHQPGGHIAAIDGHVDVATDGSDQWTSGQSGAHVVPGEILRTDGHSSATLSFERGIGVQLDHDTTLALDTHDRWFLQGGGLFVFAPAHGEMLEIRTRAGTVRSRGSNYELSVSGATLLATVSSGEIEIDTASGRIQVSSAESVVVDDAGIRRTRRPPPA